MEVGIATVLAAVVVAGALLWAAAKVVTQLALVRAEQRRSRQLSIATLFAPAIAKASDDPRALLTWQPLARTLRSLFSDEFLALDRESKSTFPFSQEALTAAHARWTTEWLAWERAHDATYKLKALEARHELQERAASEFGRAKLDAIEREKLDLYQRRYEEYVRVAKALQTLSDNA